ncbi:valine--tRNA ligase [Dethiosulfovibrio salsuginis]|uniref:Valine--tRNA ligase n=1 Tax=Dethiosulfovibrio salsuginis TaxID=561720 RepID=A0A1X7I5A5_9BACT|nr:valine--tRNA ligase [Dethiosulfovibrio salsuginis]SMG09248.1 valyl-tRNA synthetase [Dethiosulfovibrio salsuginis]
MVFRNTGLPKNYDPEPIEDKWYQTWLDKGLFDADVDHSREAFSVVIPPPNVTGSLHMGHAFNNTFQDIVCRYKRMRGYNVLWLPGTDHAGIATQNVVERQLAQEGLSRHDMSREDFVKKVWEWKEEYGNRIISQQKKLGNSCDWRRLRFTMDEGLSKAVRAVFVRLYEKGLIYRGKYIINWCPRCQTALSDLEVEHSEEPGKLYYVNYPLVGEEGAILVATTRPETILGDVAIAVHPRDEKNQKLIGKKVVVPLTGGREIPIIEDNMVDPEFGTGFVKITPAHDPNDFLVGQRHGLEQLQVIDSQGIMNENALEYSGMSVEQARVKSVEDLKELGALIKVEELPHQVGHCYRCNTVVEPYLSEQWFVKAKPLADRGVKAVEDGDIRWLPEHWTKTYYQWMENIRDWCISRQLWWGHRIPAWTCESCGKLIVSETDPDICVDCGSKSLVQDEDVLDTWFSSALWPFSTLGWPENTEELRHFYPTSLMVTGFDIIFFWVSRMIMMGMEFMDEIPFKDVYIHALVRDEKGQKMSKSKGNVIDPLTMIDQFGADALRFTVAALTMPGRDILLSPSKIENYRHFINKIWNASRFALMNLDSSTPTKPSVDELNLQDRWIMERLRSVTSQVTSFLDEYLIGDAARLLYDFIWGDLCDWYLEMSKPALRGNEGEARKNANLWVLQEVFRGVLCLLHPFVPFVTEELWQAFGLEGESMEVDNWPTTDEMAEFPGVEEEMKNLQEIVRSIRNLRAEAGIPPQKVVPLSVIRTDSSWGKNLIENSGDMICLLAKVQSIKVIPTGDVPPTLSLSSVLSSGIAYLPVGDVLDIDGELTRLRKDLAQVQSDLAKSLGKLSNENFVKRAPEDIVLQEKERVESFEKKIKRIEENITSLSME